MEKRIPERGNFKYVFLYLIDPFTIIELKMMRFVLLQKTIKSITRCKIVYI